MARLFWLVFLCVLASQARADVSITQAGRLSAMGQPGALQAFSVWNKGQKTRYDIGQITILLDLDAKTRTAIDRQTKTYRVDPYEIQEPMPPPGPIEVKPTERRTAIAGHPARLYFWKMVSKDVTVTAEIWCAEDLPRVELPALSGAGFDAAAQNKGMGGHPLRVKLVSTSGKVFGTLTTEVYALSTRPLDDAVFAVPPDFVEEKKPEKRLAP